MPTFEIERRRLFYRAEGRGPLLIILPGNTASSALHGTDLEYFARRYHAVAFDYWGTGQSERVHPWPVDWWEQGARDALALVERLGERQAVMLGCSGGAISALYAALYAPEKVRAVVADSVVRHSDPQGIRAEVANRGLRTPPQVNFWSAAHGADWGKVVEEDNRLCLAVAERGGLWITAPLERITVPVLFTGSLSDSLQPNIASETAEMARAIPGAHAYLFNGGDHPLMWACPKEFRAAVDAFLIGLDLP